MIHGIAAKLAKFSLEISLVEDIAHWQNSLMAVMASPSLRTAGGYFLMRSDLAVLKTSSTRRIQETG